MLPAGEYGSALFRSETILCPRQAGKLLTHSDQISFLYCCKGSNGTGRDCCKVYIDNGYTQRKDKEYDARHFIRNRMRHNAFLSAHKSRNNIYCFYGRYHSNPYPYPSLKLYYRKNLYQTNQNKHDVCNAVQICSETAFRSGLSRNGSVYHVTETADNVKDAKRNCERWEAKKKERKNYSADS